LQLKPVMDAVKRAEAHPIPLFPRNAAAISNNLMEDIIITAPISTTGHSNPATSHTSHRNVVVHQGNIDVYVDIVGSETNSISSTSRPVVEEAKSSVPWLSQIKAEAEAPKSIPVVVKDEPVAVEDENYKTYVNQYLAEMKRQQQLASKRPAEDSAAIHEPKRPHIEVLETQEIDPLVHVNGKPVRWTQVTEEDKELMSTDEYEVYGQIYNDRIAAGMY